MAAARGQKESGRSEDSDAPEREVARQGYSALLRGADSWLSLQSEMLESAETVVTDWMRHRREDIDSGRQALQKMAECGDLAEAVLVQQEWLSAALKRASS